MMPMALRKLYYEQGPIRPPSEAYSLLLRLTRNCPWNQCLFCPVYKGEKFSRRKLSEIKADIVAMADATQLIKEISVNNGYKGAITSQVVNLVKAENPGLIQLALWLYHGGTDAFLQDGDSLLLPAGDLVDIICFLKEQLPSINRITTYARSRTVLRRSVEELKSIKEAGLSRIHVGLESGNDQVLSFMRKGVSGAQHVEAGKKIKSAGLSLSEYVIIGLGGRDLWREHALDTAKTLNLINPDFIRLRTLAVPASTPLYREIELDNFRPLADDDLIREEELFIKTLEGINSYIFSDHILNLLEEVTGRLPEDKASMLQIISDYLSLPDQQRELFKLGRRTGYFRRIGDLNNQSLYQPVEKIYRQLEEKGLTVDKYIEDLILRFI
jgi:radical SAM superfamily enzyme YgiQ (UPF0313 family)